jgi:hypothetical protein
VVFLSPFTYHTDQALEFRILPEPLPTGQRRAGDEENPSDKTGRRERHVSENRSPIPNTQAAECRLLQSTGDLALLAPRFGVRQLDAALPPRASSRRSRHGT